MSRLMLAQAPADADERAARAQARDEMRHTAVGLRQDLGRRRLVVRPPVGVVVVLVGVEVPLRVLGEQAARFADRAVRAFHRAR